MQTRRLTSSPFCWVWFLISVYTLGLYYLLPHWNQILENIVSASRRSYWIQSMSYKFRIHHTMADLWKMSYLISIWLQLYDVRNTRIYGPMILYNYLTINSCILKPCWTRTLGLLARHLRCAFQSPVLLTNKVTGLTPTVLLIMSFFTLL